MEDIPFPALEVMTISDIDLDICVFDLGMRDGVGAAWAGGNGACGVQEGGDVGGCGRRMGFGAVD